MHRLIIVLMSLTFVFGAALQAQNPPTPAKPTAQAAPTPAQQAYQAAWAIKDPQEKVRALQKFLADFPDSPLGWPAAAQVRSLSIDAVVKATNDFLAAQKFRDARSKDDAGRCWENFFIAFELLRRDALLGLAEKYARDGLGYWNAAGRDDPSMRVNGADSFLRQADMRGLLGQILFKQGRHDEAEPLLRQAWAGHPSDMGMTMTSLPYLADIALELGRETDALTYLTEMELNGMMPAAKRDQFRALYRKAHGGSLESLDQQLDERYAATHPRLAVTPFQPGASRTGRAVLADVFTGTGCGPCVGVDRAFDAVLDRYGRDDVIVLMHHVHIPSPDPLTNRATEARQKFYGVGATPEYFIDGRSSSEGGGPADEAETILSKDIEPALQRDLAQKPDARLSLRVTTKGASVRAAVTANQINQPSGSVKLHLALVEDHVRYVGRNGVRFHSMVVRAMTGDAAGIAVKGRNKVTAEQTFDLAKVSADLRAYLDDYETHSNPPDYKFDEKKYQLDPAQLAVVAFLQDESSKRVLQAAYAPVK